MLFKLKLPKPLDLKSTEIFINTEIVKGKRRHTLPKHNHIQAVLGLLSAKLICYFSEYLVKKKYPEIAKIQYKAREDGGLSGDYKFLRLYEISKIIKEFDIKTVCEFGSGASTALWANLADHVVSFEENKYYLNKTKQLIKKFKNINLIHKKRVIKQVNNELVTFYDIPNSFFKKSFDLIYIDGPTAKILKDDSVPKSYINNTTLRTPNVDIIKFFINNNFPKYIVIDGRISTVKNILKEYSEFYDFYPRYFYENKNMKSGTYLYHSIFIKK